MCGVVRCWRLGVLSERGAGLPADVWSDLRRRFPDMMIAPRRGQERSPGPDAWEGRMTTQRLDPAVYQGEQFCYLTTTGRRTGQPHTIEISCTQSTAAHPALVHARAAGRCSRLAERPFGSCYNPLVRPIGR